MSSFHDIFDQSTETLIRSCLTGTPYPQVRIDEDTFDPNVYLGWHIGDTVDTYLNEPTPENRQSKIGHLVDCLETDETSRTTLEQHLGDYIDAIHSIAIKNNIRESLPEVHVAHVNAELLADHIGIKTPRFVTSAKESLSAAMQRRRASKQKILSKESNIDTAFTTRRADYPSLKNLNDPKNNVVPSNNSKFKLTTGPPFLTIEYPPPPKAKYIPEWMEMQDDSFHFVYIHFASKQPRLDFSKFPAGAPSLTVKLDAYENQAKVTILQYQTRFLSASEIGKTVGAIQLIAKYKSTYNNAETFSWVSLELKPVSSKSLHEYFVTGVKIVTQLPQRRTKPLPPTPTSQIGPQRPTKPLPPTPTSRIGPRIVNEAYNDPHRFILPIPPRAVIAYQGQLNGNLARAEPFMFRLSIHSEKPELWTYLDTNAAGSYTHGTLQRLGRYLYSGEFDPANTEPAIKRGWSVLFTDTRNTTTLTIEFNYETTRHYFMGKRVLHRPEEPVDDVVYGTVIEPVGEDNDKKFFLLIFHMKRVNKNRWIFKSIEFQWLVDNAHHQQIMDMFSGKNIETTTAAAAAAAVASSSSSQSKVAIPPPLPPRERTGAPIGGRYALTHFSKATTTLHSDDDIVRRTAVVIGKDMRSASMWIMDILEYTVLSYDIRAPFLLEQYNMFEQAKVGTVVNYVRSARSSRILDVEFILPMVVISNPLYQMTAGTPTYFSTPKIGRIVTQVPVTSSMKYDMIWVCDVDGQLYYNLRSLGDQFLSLSRGKYIEFTYVCFQTGLRAIVDVLSVSTGPIKGEHIITLPNVRVPRTETATILCPRETDDMLATYLSVSPKMTKRYYIKQLFYATTYYNNEATAISSEQAQQLLTNVKLNFVYRPIDWNRNEQRRLRDFGKNIFDESKRFGKSIMLQTEENTTCLESIVLAAHQLSNIVTDSVPVVFLGPQTAFLKLAFDSLNSGVITNLVSFGGLPDTKHVPASGADAMKHYVQNFVTPVALNLYLSYLRRNGFSDMAKRSTAKQPAFRLVVNHYERNTLSSFLRILRIFFAINKQPFPLVEIVIMCSMETMERLDSEDLMRVHIQYPKRTPDYSSTTSPFASSSSPILRTREEDDPHYGNGKFTILANYVLVPHNLLKVTASSRFINLFAEGFDWKPFLWRDIPETHYGLRNGGRLWQQWYNDLHSFDAISLSSVAADIKTRLAEFSLGTPLKQSETSIQCQQAISTGTVEKREQPIGIDFRAALFRPFRRGLTTKKTRSSKPSSSVTSHVTYDPTEWNVEPNIPKVVIDVSRQQCSLGSPLQGFKKSRDHINVGILLHNTMTNHIIDSEFIEVYESEDRTMWYLKCKSERALSSSTPASITFLEPNDKKDVHFFLHPFDPIKGGVKTIDYWTKMPVPDSSKRNKQITLRSRYLDADINNKTFSSYLTLKPDTGDPSKRIKANPLKFFIDSLVVIAAPI